MDNLINNWKKNAKANYQSNLKSLKSLRGNKSVDKMVTQLDEEVFSKADCLQCANCCRTTPAIVTRPDAKRIAKHMGIPPKTFIRKYLIQDIDGELMMNGVPCTFLNSDNTCDIYEVRPMACREYPHTHQTGYNRRPLLNAKNTIVCPAAFEILNRLKENLNL